MDLSHQLPDGPPAAAMPNDFRVDLILGSECWIGYPRAEAVLARLHLLYKYGPGRVRPPNALLIAPSNNGKSTLIERFRRDHQPPPEAGNSAEAETIPVVVVQMPSEPTVSRFYAALLHELAAPRLRAGPGRRKQDLERMALDVLQGVQARVLVIDELHNLLGGKQDSRREFLNLLRYLGNDLRIPIVGAGVRDAHIAIRTDPQLETRFEPLTLPLWKAGQETATLVASFVASLPLRQPSPDLAKAGVLRTLVERTGGAIGEILDLLRAAAVTAIESGEESITSGVLADAGYLGPGERRAQLERDLGRRAA
jgi:hypothetical protein